MHVMFFLPITVLIQGFIYLDEGLKSPDVSFPLCLFSFKDLLVYSVVQFPGYEISMEQT